MLIWILKLMISSSVGTLHERDHLVACWHKLLPAVALFPKDFLGIAL